jgi:sugar-specific transcriptional regulator TrmB
MEKLVKELMSLGLTSNEANVYVYFAQINSNVKIEAFRHHKIEDQELSNNLLQLRKKGFIEINSEDSNTFSVIPLQIVMERLIKEKLREVQEIRGEIRDHNLP